MMTNEQLGNLSNRLKMFKLPGALSAEAVEYIDCISAEE